ncbi:hypothetical protein HRG_003479 [Hirsutella rhossiliensis]|uniref:Uncharacterized protein n=1 Tax=Hirsutella rhossiliensis TaxID=111463 RepID=A0A9P8SJM5_9HYPO|nr:uncharacterized protein HRG_03479 [Hirsutella rhossiliensis]KAH0965463.1 hypothetical protein HRG_03479 [Hirsutella rhossiliensis]
MQFSVISLFALCTVAMAASIDRTVVDGLQKRQNEAAVVPLNQPAMRNDADGPIQAFANPGAAGDA